MNRIVAVAAALGAAAALAGAGTAAAAPPLRGPTVTMCHAYALRTVANSGGLRYMVRNDVFGAHDRECLTVRHLWSNFTVTSSTADSIDTQAYPNIFYGCGWGICTPKTVLPERVRRAMSFRTTWQTRRNAGGRWNAAYDIWIARRNVEDGQDQGAEIMIWLGVRGFPAPWGRPVLRIGGYRWWYARHLACNASGCWNYVLFRMVVPALGVRRLPLGPFFRVAERYRQVLPGWWLTSVDAGFEIWRGGRGLATTGFRVIP